MDIRKLQSTGGSSLSVILPKKWIITHSLKDKEEVLITENYSGVINISPLKIQTSNKSITVDLDKIDSIAISNTLKALYKVGYDEINFTSKELHQKNKTIIKKTLLELMGFEIVEEKSDQIVLKNLIDYNRMPVSLMQQKAISGTLSMMKDSILAIKSYDVGLAQDVVDRDSEIDKICLYIQRVYYSILTSRVSEKEVFLSSLKLNFYKEIVIQIERIADNATRLARTLVMGGDLKVQDKSEFLDRSEKILPIIQLIFDILKNENYIEVNRIATKVAEIKKLTIYNEIDLQNGTFNEAVVLDCLNQVRGQIKNIIEIINDYMIIQG